MIRRSCKGGASLARSLLFVSTCWSSNINFGNPWGKYPAAIPAATLQFVRWLFVASRYESFFFFFTIFFSWLFPINHSLLAMGATIKFDIWRKSLSIAWYACIYPMCFRFISATLELKQKGTKTQEVNGQSIAFHVICPIVTDIARTSLIWYDHFLSV